MDCRAALGLVFFACGGVAYAHTDQLGDSGTVIVTTLRVDDERQLLGELVGDGYAIGGVSLENGTIDVLTRTADEGRSLRFQGREVAATQTIDTSLAPDVHYKTH